MYSSGSCLKRYVPGYYIALGLQQRQQILWAPRQIVVDKDDDIGQ
jgi:hypothetical protein